MRNKFSSVMKKVMHNSSITMMSLASAIAVVNFTKCLIFLGEVNKEDDVNEESLRELKLYMKELRGRDETKNR